MSYDQGISASNPPLPRPLFCSEDSHPGHAVYEDDAEASADPGAEEDLPRHPPSLQWAGARPLDEDTLLELFQCTSSGAKSPCKTGQSPATRDLEGLGGHHPQGTDLDQLRPPKADRMRRKRRTSDSLGDGPNSKRARCGWKTNTPRPGAVVSDALPMTSAGGEWPEFHLPSSFTPSEVDSLVAQAYAAHYGPPARHAEQTGEEACHQRPCETG